MGYWKWLFDKLKIDLTTPFLEFVVGFIIIMGGWCLLYELLAGWSLFIILRTLCIMAVGGLIMSHGWYRKWGS